MTATMGLGGFTSLLDDSFIFERLTEADYPKFVTQTIRILGANSGLRLIFASNLTESCFMPEEKIIRIPPPPAFPKKDSQKKKFFKDLAEWRGVLNHEVGHARYTMWKARKKEDIKNKIYHKKHHAFVDLFENGRMERVVCQEYPGMLPDLQKLEEALDREIKKMKKKDEKGFNHLYYAMRMAINGYEPVTEIPERIKKDWDKCMEFVKEAWATDDEEETIEIAKKAQKYLEERMKEEIENAKNRKKEKGEKEEKLEKIKMKMEDISASMPNLSDENPDENTVEVEVEDENESEENEEGENEEEGSGSGSGEETDEEEESKGGSGSDTPEDEDYEEENEEEGGKGSSKDEEEGEKAEKSEGEGGEEGGEEDEEEEGEEGNAGEGEEEKSDAEKELDELKKETEKLEEELEELKKEEEESPDADDLDTEEVVIVDPMKSVAAKENPSSSHRRYRSYSNKDVVPMPLDDYVDNYDILPDDHSEDTSKTLQTIMGSISGMAQRFIQKVRSSRHVGSRTYQGRVSPRNLHKFRTSKNIFKTENIRKKKGASVMIIVDCSGSMAGLGKIDTALKSALVMGEIMSQAKVEFELVGFTVGTSEFDFNAFTRTANLRHYRFGSDKDWTHRKHGILDAARKLRMADNDDGESLRQFASEIAKSKKERKMMIVISDGQPLSCSQQGNTNKDLHRAIKEIRDEGTEIYAVGLDTDVGKFYGDNKSVRIAAACKTEELINAMAQFIGLIENE